MSISNKMRHARIEACRRDLLREGIDLERVRDRELQSLITQYLNYFQMILKEDASPDEIAALVRHTRGQSPSAQGDSPKNGHKGRVRTVAQFRSRPDRNNN